jgi:mRNA degradation ribonuclease J1/J2
VQTLKYLVRELRPKTLIPLHTERPEKFARLFDAPVRVLQDGQTLLL